MSATEWVFRHAGGCLIEAPDLAEPLTPPSGEPWPWIATVWADPTAGDGWGAHEWERAQRGWWLPSTIAIGDVVEFGITWPAGAETEATVRWYGWLQRCTVHGARCTVHGARARARWAVLPSKSRHRSRQADN